MPYTQLYYHLVWATKGRAPLLTAEVEPIVYGFLRSKAAGLGATVFGLNGLPDHVHIIVTIPPAIAVATFVGQVKAVASTRTNKTYEDGPRFSWQSEYATFSFDRRRLNSHIAYVRSQKAHHRDHHTIPVLEMVGNVASEDHHAAEPRSSYGVEDENWWTEMLSL
jgi:putative transposase